MKFIFLILGWLLIQTPAFANVLDKESIDEKILKLEAATGLETSNKDFSKIMEAFSVQQELDASPGFIKVDSIAGVNNTGWNVLACLGAELGIVVEGGALHGCLNAKDGEIYFVSIAGINQGTKAGGSLNLSIIVIDSEDGLITGAYLGSSFGWSWYFGPGAGIFSNENNKLYMGEYKAGFSFKLEETKINIISKN